MNRSIGTAIFAFTFLAAGQASAALLIPSTAVWAKQMGVNPNLMSQDPAGGVAGAPTNNLTLSMNSALDGMTISGQVTYTWTLSAAATAVSELYVSDDEMVATADIDPSYTTSSMVLNVQNIGFISSNDADWELETPLPARVYVPPHGGAPVQVVGVNWLPTQGTAGTPVNFNVAQASPAPFAYSGVAGDKMQLDTLGNGLWLKLTPPGGAPFFPASSTVSIVVDFPIVGSGIVVPEPTTSLLSPMGMWLMYSLHRPLRRRRKAERGGFDVRSVH